MHDVAKLVVGYDVAHHRLVESRVAALRRVAGEHVAEQRLLADLGRLTFPLLDALGHLALIRDRDALEAGGHLLPLCAVLDHQAQGGRVHDDRDADGAAIGVVARRV